MKADIKKRWIAALRSGEYQQGQGYLRPTENSWCCLGVLCDLYAKDGHAEWRAGSQFYEFVYDNLAFPATGVLPTPVIKWAGLADVCVDYIPLVDDGDAHRSLAGMNDSGVSFQRIAALIEEQL